MLKVFGFLLAIFACSSKVATGFSPLPHRARAATFLAVKFDKKLNKWITTKNDEGPEAGYDIWGTLLRGGPKPFLARVFGPDQYEQAVLKVTSGIFCSADNFEILGEFSLLQVISHYIHSLWPATRWAEWRHRQTWIFTCKIPTIGSMIA